MGQAKRRTDVVATAWAREQLAAVGLPSKIDNAALRRISADYPEWYSEYRAAADEAEADLTGTSLEVCAKLRHLSVETSLALHAAISVEDSFRALVWWYQNRPTEVRTLLDLGCGNGVVTCAMAAAIPDARILGIDISESAVTVAREIASLRGLTNVEFRVGNLSKLDVGQFDAIATSLALCNAGIFEDEVAGSDPFRTTTGLDGPAQIPDPAVTSLASHLAFGGTITLFERFQTANQFVLVASSLAHAGINVDLETATATPDSAQIDENPTVLIGLTGQRCSPTTDPASIASWVRGPGASVFGSTWLNELAFEDLIRNGATFLRGAEFDYAGFDPKGGIERRELWWSGRRQYMWTSSTRQFRELTYSERPGELEGFFDRYVAEREASGLPVRRY